MFDYSHFSIFVYVPRVYSNSDSISASLSSHFVTRVYYTTACERILYDNLITRIFAFYLVSLQRDFSGFCANDIRVNLRRVIKNGYG